MQEQDERLRLEFLMLEPVPRNQKDRLVGLVVVEPNRLLGASDIPGSSSSWYIFTRQAAKRTCRSSLGSSEMSLSVAVWLTIAFTLILFS